MNHILAVACASITGITLGIALHHKQSLKDPSMHATASAGAPYSLTQNSSYADAGTQTDSVLVAGPIADLSHLEKKLNLLIEQQDTMRSQQSELNREINAIQFRLDTHSASFRPLRSERESKIIFPGPGSSTSAPLLPPLQ